MREIARFIMLGRFHAIGMAAVFGGLSLIFLPLACLSAATAGLVGLRKGWWDSLVVVLVTSGTTLVAASMITSKPGMTFPLVFTLLIPVFVCAQVLRATESQGSVLVLVGIFAAMFVAGMHVLFGDVVTWWQDWLSEAIKGVKGATLEGFEREGTLRLMNGLVALMFGVLCMVSVLISRWWQSLLYHPGGFAQEFRSLRLPIVLLPVTIIVLLLASSISQIFLADLFMVAVMIYFFQGLAVMHGVLAKHSASGWWIAPIYLGLMLMPQYLLTGLALVGAADTIVRFRVISPKK